MVTSLQSQSQVTKEVYRNTRYEQCRLHRFQQPARPFRVGCKQEHATQTFPKCLCLWPGAVPEPSCYQHRRACSSCTACSPKKSTVSVSSPLPSLPLGDLYHPCYPCLQKWSSGELFCTKKKKTHCWLQVKTYPCISPASQCQLSDFGEVWGRWRSEDGKLKYVKQGSPSAVFKDHSQFLPTCFVII